MGHGGLLAAPSSLLYHRRSPCAIVRIEPVDSRRIACCTPNHPLRPHHLRTPSWRAGGRRRRRAGRHRCSATTTSSSRASRATASSPLYRNAVGDELVYVQSGAAVLESVFGALPVGAGDYV